MKRILLLAACMAFFPAAPALAQSGANVLLIVNETSPESGRIAEHYARVRSVPPEQVIRISVPAADEIERDVFSAKIQEPIGLWLRAHFAQDRILYIVLTKGVPLRVKGTAGRDGTVASVDSELTLLYARLLGYDPKAPGRLRNPYFLGGAPIAQAKAFSRDSSELYLVTRLDGYTVEDVIGVIDRGAAPVREGRILLDLKEGLIDAIGNEWMRAAAVKLNAAGFGDRVMLEETTKVLTGLKSVLGYYSWGSNDWAITTRRFGFGFVPGALAAMYVSTDGRTFSEPPASWTIGKWTDQASFFAGSPQSLAGDLIREGVTGIAAHVAEPYLDASVRPDILFPAYVSGFNLAESFYLALPYLSWQTVVVGDPLCAPFPRKTPQQAVADKGIDPATELPALFSAKRLQLMTAQGIKPDAAKAMMRGEARTAKGDKAGARQALEEATAADPKLVSVHLRLATGYEADGEYDKAIERYRAVLAVNPDNLVALNNLAFGLAVHKHQPAEAEPIAEQAMAASKGRIPEVADTLAWVRHLLGRDREAAPILERLVKAVPERADYRWHAAAVFAALGRLEEATTQLREALRLDPELEKNDEVKALQLKLK